ncbi:MAG: DUF488 domain-containing protein [Smithellaceae bacterium]
MAIYTIGHSNHALENFIAILKTNTISAVADVRSSPYSGMYPHFNREPLASSLKIEGIAYVFLGNELGARPDDRNCYTGGSADFKKMADRSEYRVGLNRVLKGAEKYRLALLCAERDPIFCHRTILVSRSLVKLGMQVKHILSDGSQEDHFDTSKRLIRYLGLDANLFTTSLSENELIDRAFEEQARLISHSKQVVEDENE